MSITRAAIDLTVVETNRHAAQCSGKNSWKTCTEEVLAYFGFCRISQKRFMEIKSFMHL